MFVTFEAGVLCVFLFCFIIIIYIYYYYFFSIYLFLGYLFTCVIILFTCVIIHCMCIVSVECKVHYGSKNIVHV